LKFWKKVEILEKFLKKVEILGKFLKKVEILEKVLKKVEILEKTLKFLKKSYAKIWGEKEDGPLSERGLLFMTFYF
jgi:hypothetical protein